jgi:hypothetical protein
MNCESPQLAGIFHEKIKFSKSQIDWLATQRASNRSPPDFPANKEFNRENRNPASIRFDEIKSVD